MSTNTDSSRRSTEPLNPNSTDKGVGEAVEQEQIVSKSLFKFLDSYGRYLQYGACGLGIVGLFLIGRSIRLSTKFPDAGSIPPEFYKKNMTLYGRVREIDVTESIVLVEHLPILRQRKKVKSHQQATASSTHHSSIELIKLQVPGLEFKSTPDSKSKLEGKILDRKIKFTLLKLEEAEEIALCLIYCKGFLLMRNFGAWCISCDVGEFSSDKFMKLLPSNHNNSNSDSSWNWKDNKQFSIYYNKIIKLQQYKNNRNNNKKASQLWSEYWTTIKDFVTKTKLFFRFKR